MFNPTLKINSTPIWAWCLALIPGIIFVFDFSLKKDQEWFLAINHATSQLPDLLWTGLSLFGNGWSVLGLALPLLLIYRRALYSAVISGVFAGLFSSFAKKLASTDRPAAVLSQDLFHIIDKPLMHSAMPSGHTMTAFSIATAIYFSLPKNKHPAWNLVFVIAIGTGISRIAVGAHWPEDVFVGASLGILSGLIGASIGQGINTSALTITAWPVKVILAASLVSLYFLVRDTLDFAMNQILQDLIAGIIIVTWIRILPKLIKQTI
jgi:membrane-associated phospholipid phosphatase